MCSYVYNIMMLFIWLNKVTKLMGCNLTAVHVSMGDDKQVYEAVRSGKYRFGNQPHHTEQCKV